MSFGLRISFGRLCRLEKLREQWRIAQEEDAKLSCGWKPHQYRRRCWPLRTEDVFESKNEYDIFMKFMAEEFDRIIFEHLSKDTEDNS